MDILIPLCFVNIAPGLALMRIGSHTLITGFGIMLLGLAQLKHVEHNAKRPVSTYRIIPDALLGMYGLWQ